MSFPTSFTTEFILMYYYYLWSNKDIMLTKIINDDQCIITTSGCNETFIQPEGVLSLLKEVVP